MKYEFKGKSLESAVRQAVSQSVWAVHEQKGFRSTRAYAGPLTWGPWVDVFTQFGVASPDAVNHVTKVNISFEQVGELATPFEIEIKGGDNEIRSTGPGTESVTVTGNVATTVRVRCRSLSFGTAIEVSADW